MLMRFLSHLFGLDVTWLADDLLLTFLPFVMMWLMFYWAHDEWKGYGEAAWKFFAYFLLAYGILDVLSLMGWTLFAQNHMLEWGFVAFFWYVMLPGTPLIRYKLPIMVGSIFALSYLFA